MQILSRLLLQTLAQMYLVYLKQKVARIVQALTQPAEDYDQQIQQSFVRDVDSIVQKLNTTYQQDLKDEAEAEAYFFG